MSSILKNKEHISREEIRRQAGLVLRLAEYLRFGRRWKRPNAVRV